MPIPYIGIDLEATPLRIINLILAPTIPAQISVNMMLATTLLPLLLLSPLEIIHAFSTTAPASSRRASSISSLLPSNLKFHAQISFPFSSTAIFESNAENGVEAASLAGLGDNHAAVGENMAKSVAAWLDAEVRLPLTVHVENCFFCIIILLWYCYYHYFWLN